MVVPWSVLCSVLRAMGYGRMLPQLWEALAVAGIVLPMPKETPPTKPSEQPRAPELNWHEAMTDRPGGPLEDDRRDTEPCEPGDAEVELDKLVPSDPGDQGEEIE